MFKCITFIMMCLSLSIISASAETVTVVVFNNHSVSVDGARCIGLYPWLQEPLRSFALSMAARVWWAEVLYPLFRPIFRMLQK